MDERKSNILIEIGLRGIVRKDSLNKTQLQLQNPKPNLIRLACVAVDVGQIMSKPRKSMCHCVLFTSSILHSKLHSPIPVDRILGSLILYYLLKVIA